MTDRQRLVGQLLEFPDGHPYAKWTGTHWRLVQLADAGVQVPDERLQPAVEAALGWLIPGLEPVLTVAGRPRRHGSIEGNAVYALTRLGFADDPRTRLLVDALLAWQWPDGGWNCDRHPHAHRSSFHESAVTALGLATYAAATGHCEARTAAELLLEHRLFRSTLTGEPIRPSWSVPHYPAYWHYDVLMGLRVLVALDRVDDPRAGDALDLVEQARRGPGRFAGRTWTSTRQPAAVDWGRAPDNLLLNEIASAVLASVGRST